MGCGWKKEAFLALTCVGFLSSADADAAIAPDAPDADPGAAPDTITVNGHQDDPVVNLKLAAPLIDTPRSVTVIPESLIRDTGSVSLVDALRTVPGITFGAAEGGNPIGDRPFIRGFDAQGSSYLDGVRDLGAQSREVFAIEQIQVIKGADSTLGGRGSAGGTINIVSKLPRLTDFANADASFGNAGFKRLTADVNQRIGPMAAVRIEAMWHDQDVAGRDAIFQRRWGIAPSATIGLGTPTRLTAAYYHLHTDELPDSGLPYTYVCSASLCNAPAGFTRSEPVHHVTTRGGQSLTVPYTSFYGLRDRDFRRSDTDQVTLRAEHDFGDAVTLRNTARYSRTAQAYIYTQPDDSQGNVVGTTATNGIVNGITQYTAGGTVWRRANTRWGSTDSMIDQIDLTARFRTGLLKHTVAAGLEFSVEHAERGTFVTRGFLANGNEILSTGSTQSPRCTSATVARYNCTTLVAPNPADPWVNYANDSSTTPAPIVKSLPIQNTINDGITRAVYLFDSIAVGERLIVNLGLRYDDFSSEVSPGQAVGTTTRFTLRRRDRTLNYQAGLVYKPSADTSLYASTASSSTPPNSLLGEGQEPNALGTALTASALGILNQLKPERTRNYEIGAKANLFHAKLALTLALFRTESTNARVSIDANTVAFVGKKRAQGVEFGFNGKLTRRWSVFGGYSYLDAIVRDGGFTALTAPALGARAAQTVYVASAMTGRQFPQTAKHSFSAWTDYQLDPRLSVGGGAFYMSRVYGGYADNRQAVQNAAGVVSVLPATSIIARSVPAYWRFDARASYRLTRHASLSVNAQNLTNKRYFSQAYASHYATLAPGRTVFATLSLGY